MRESERLISQKPRRTFPVMDGAPVTGPRFSVRSLSDADLDAELLHRRGGAAWVQACLTEHERRHCG